MVLNFLQCFIVDLEKRKDANAASSAPSSKASKRKICKYFAAENSCYFGEWCRFLHIRTEIKENNSEPVPSYANVKPARVIVRPNIAAISRANIGKKEQLDIRNSEINYFGRRFHDAKFAYEGSSCLIEFEYKITDPEWVRFLNAFIMDEIFGMIRFFIKSTCYLHLLYVNRRKFRKNFA